MHLTPWRPKWPRTTMPSSNTQSARQHICPGTMARASGASSIAWMLPTEHSLEKLAENLRKTTWWEKGFYSSLPGAAEFIEVQSLLLISRVSLGSL